MSENFIGNDYKIIGYADLDSTTYVTPEMLNRMHIKANKDKNFRKGIKYASQKDRKLLYLPVTMEINNEKTKRTFYMTEDVQEIVAFK